MMLRLACCALLSLILSVPALGQTQHPLRSPESDQPARLPVPTLVPRAPQQPQQPQPAAAPFTLTQQESAEVDRVLDQWERHNREIKTFDCRFTRWTYDLVFNPPQPGQAPEAKYVDMGAIRYAAPDRGMYRVETTEQNGQQVPVEPGRADHWISDGKSIFEFNATKKQLIEHKLPPELQGKAIADSPLPFLFGAEAQKLKQRYWIRLVTPPGMKDQIHLEAYPRFQQDAANFHHAQFRISTAKMEPFALQVVQPNNKDYVTYQFYDVVVNDPLRMFKGDPFRAYTPSGWTKIVEQPPAAKQASRPAN